MRELIWKIGIVLIVCLVVFGCKREAQTERSSQPAVPAKEAVSEPESSAEASEAEQAEVSAAEPAEASEAEQAEVSAAEPAEASEAEQAEVSAAEPAEASEAEQAEVSAAEPAEASEAEQAEVSAAEPAEASEAEQAEVSAAEPAEASEAEQAEVSAAEPAEASEAEQAEVSAAEPAEASEAEQAEVSAAEPAEASEAEQAEVSAAEPAEASEAEQAEVSAAEPAEASEAEQAEVSAAEPAEASEAEQAEVSAAEPAEASEAEQAEVSAAEPAEASEAEQADVSAAEPAEEPEAEEKPAKEPSTAAKAEHKPGEAGLAFSEKLIEVLDYELNERFLGWRPNDVIFGRITDNVREFQLGALAAMRQTAVKLKETLTRFGASDSNDPHLIEAVNLLMNSADQYWFPSAESQYKLALEELRNFVKNLKEDESRFYPRIDNLFSLIASYKDLLGASYDNLVKELEHDGSRVSFFQADNYFYYAQGVAYVVVEMLKTVRVGFENQLSNVDAVELMDQIIEDLERAVACRPWLITNSHDDGILANHRFNLASSMSAALYNMSNMLTYGSSGGIQQRNPA